jgi:hypothetical protein
MRTGRQFETSTVPPVGTDRRAVRDRHRGAPSGRALPLEDRP